MKPQHKFCHWPWRTGLAARMLNKHAADKVQFDCAVTVEREDAV
jgi:hypothetical protein